MSDTNSAAKHPLLRSNAALERLATFVGEWNLEFTGFHADPSTVARGRSSFRWLEGGAFLLQHAEVPKSDFPSETAVIGADEKAGTWCMLYFDSRGVSRIYHMTLSGGIWTLWRNFPGFSQRFLGTFSDDANTITGRWETSTDGSTWEHDFNLTYTRAS